MRLLKGTACLLLILLCAGGVSLASPVGTIQATVTYTADNMVMAWWLIGPSQTAQPLTLGTNSSDWQKADSYQLSLQPGQSYQLVWEVKNLWAYPSPLPGPDNPAGFLAQISFGGQAPILTSDSWKVANYTHLIALNEIVWGDAAVWGVNAGSNIWNTVNGGAIAGIDGNAHWIWSSDNIKDQHIFVATQFTAPVPLPAAAWMLGAGLIGLVALRRQRPRVANT
jgi:hypothetical protein